MPNVQAAGFGGGITLQEVVLIIELLFVALIVVNIATYPNENVFAVIGDRVLGYPTCKGVFCMLPSQQSLVTMSTAFSGSFSQNAGIQEWVNLVLSGFDIIKGLIGFVVVLGGLIWFFIGVYYPWLYYTGVLRRPMR